MEHSMEHADRPVTVALAGNPNVGKSTIFNGLTGMRQRTGNWSGVTVASARGRFFVETQEFLLVDLPGTYSLAARSQEEAIAHDYLCSGEAELIILICDATCLERGLHLLKQIIELDQIKDSKTPIILCVNLCDEARRKGIELDFELLQDVLQIPVLCCCARQTEYLNELRKTIRETVGQQISYDCLDFEPKQLAAETVRYTRTDYRRREELIDRIVTGPVTGGILMFLLLLGVFWLTLSGANIPSALLWDGLFWLEGKLAALLLSIGVSPWLVHMLVYGVYRVLAWVTSVMLPPMAIFFPLFTLLEDLGYLPRIAFNMDKAFHRCRACGKQCLTTAMGFGCNAAGVTGCRIIDSPRERVIAILTNSLVPCNGRLPTLFLMITLLFLAFGTGNASVSASLLSALFMTLLILLGVGATLASSWLLSHTLLRGVPSSFTLELPPYRRPQIGRIIIRSIFDRTLFVLGRAVAVAAPAGLIIWLLANILYVGPENGWLALRPVDGILSETGAALSTSAPSLLTCLTGLLDPLGRLLGLDGVILTAFLLGFPANEIVMPIILMAYQQMGTLTEMGSSSALLELLLAQGWTGRTFICMMIFCLFHWPCSTTVLTIKKETGSFKWTAVSVLLPTMIGMGLCLVVTGLSRLIAFTFFSG